MEHNIYTSRPLRSTISLRAPPAEARTPRSHERSCPPPHQQKARNTQTKTHVTDPHAGISVASPQWLQSRIGHGNVTPRAHTSARHRAGRGPVVNPRSSGFVRLGTPTLPPRAATHGQPPGRAPGSPPEEPPAVILWVVPNMRVPGNCTPATRQWGLCACARKRYGDSFGAGRSPGIKDGEDAAAVSIVSSAANAERAREHSEGRAGA